MEDSNFDVIVVGASAISRDHVLPGRGGETIGLAQVVGQNGR